MAGQTVSKDDQEFLLQLLRQSDRPLSTDELVAALKEHHGSSE